MDITVDELIALGENGATVINASKHAGSHEIRGAIRYRPSDLLTADRLVLPVPTDLPVVLYDDHEKSESLTELAAKLEQSGFADVRILVGGFAAYTAANAPTQEASTTQIVPPTKPQEV